MKWYIHNETVLAVVGLYREIFAHARVKHAVSIDMYFN